METSNSLKKEKGLVSSVQGVQRAAPWVLLLGIIFIAVNMRAPLTSVGPLVELIRDHLQLSNTMTGMITTLPLLSFALFSPFVPKLARRFGMETVLFIAVIFLTIGIAMRALSGSAVIILYAGTAILGLGIAACNVLLPSLVKREFPERIGLMTGIYSISMNLFGAIASGVSITIAVGFGFLARSVRHLGNVKYSWDFVLGSTNKASFGDDTGSSAASNEENDKCLAVSTCLASDIVYGIAIDVVLYSCCMVT